MIKAWLQRRKDRQSEEAYTNGFTWAAGVLLAKECGTEDLLDFIRETAALDTVTSINCHRSNSFDEGARDAVESWRQLVEIKDDE